MEQLRSSNKALQDRLREANRKVAEVKTELSVASTTIVSLRQQVLDIEQVLAECEEKRLALESAQQASQPALARQQKTPEQIKFLQNSFSENDYPSSDKR